MKFNFKSRSFFNLLPFFIAVFVFGGCQSIPKKTSPELQVVPYVDIERYLGKWYEIALYPNWFEKGCFRSTAFYEKLENGQIKVTNRCRMYASDGELNEAIGKASIVDKRTNAKLKVQFFWPFKGDYWIIDLDKNYQYAVVSEPARQYLWILSRSPNLDNQTLEKLKNKIRDKGFELSYLKKTLQ
ncbi:MAG: lipocalin family protein [Nitrospinota bacterium]|nr:lipocalin family protein [Nitrospinota bacterium]MEC8956972.1 lipocalin family protein [Nitrospinota bacterium]MEC9018565.1 lipocalin family protein [Nitrospinota bacterium]MED5353822.1 lipocalin family protein [Nitrospinota bacterium]